jgi:hypothetical protein
MPTKAGFTRIPIPFDELSAPAQRALRASGYKTLQQLALVTEHDIARLHGLGPRTMKILHLHMRRNKLAFAKVRRR